PADLLTPCCAIGYGDAGRTVQGYPNHRPTRLKSQVQVPEVETFLAEEGLEASGKLFPQLSTIHAVLAHVRASAVKERVDWGRRSTRTCQSSARAPTRSSGKFSGKGN